MRTRRFDAPPSAGIDQVGIVVQVALVLELRLDVAPGTGLAADAHLRIHFDVDRDLAVSHQGRHPS